MYKIFSKFVYVLLTATVLGGCYKDLGNYDYTEPNKVSFSNINESYVALLGEKLTITPTLAFTTDNSNDTSKYEYEWIALRTDNVLPADVRKELAFTRNLDITVTVPPGPYRVHYRVKDKNTGIQFVHTFLLTIQSTVFEGWMMLCDDAGKSRVDMISVVNADSARVLKNVLNFTGSNLPDKYLQKPEFIHCYPYDPTFYGIYVSSNGGTSKVHPETFKWETTYDVKYEFVGQVADNFVIDNISNLASNTAYLHSTAGDVYYYYRVFQTRPSTPINLVPGELKTFKAHKDMAFASVAGNGFALMYDIENKRFLRHTSNGAVVTKMPTGTLFNYDSVGMDLVYMKYSRYNAGNAFAILKDPTTQKHHLARISIGTAINQLYFAEMTATDIDQAENFSVSPDYGYVFYNVGSKVYSYDFNLKASKLMMDLGSKKISKMVFHDFIATKYAATRSQLAICTYDAAEPSSTGELSLYNLAPVQGPLSLAKSYKGIGKVVSLTYRER